MKTSRILLTAVAGLLLMGACKPTEKNYRAAYDAAKAKREYKDPDEELLTGGHRLLSDDATNWVVLGKDSLQTERIWLKPYDGSMWPQSGPYRLAVAMFKMSTNATSILDDLKKHKELTPIVAQDGQKRLFLIAGSATKPDSLGAVLTTFRKAVPDFTYIGMTDSQPMVIFSR